MNNNKNQLSQEMNAEQQYELPPLSDYVVVEWVAPHYEAKEVAE